VIVVLGLAVLWKRSKRTVVEWDSTGGLNQKFDPTVQNGKFTPPIAGPFYDLQYEVPTPIDPTYACIRPEYESAEKSQPIYDSATSSQAAEEAPFYDMGTTAEAMEWYDNAS
jgi:hypothetical protein